jgi:hypothetical protein
LTTCVLRLAWIQMLDTSAVDVTWVYASYPVSWAALLAVLAVYWLYLRRKLMAGKPETA